MNRLRREDRWERLGRNSTGAPAVAAIRRLSAIMAADVAGYSRLMEADEEGTHLRVKAHLRELIDAKRRRAPRPHRQKHRGRDSGGVPQRNRRVSLRGAHATCHDLSRGRPYRHPRR